MTVIILIVGPLVKRYRGKQQSQTQVPSTSAGSRRRVGEQVSVAAPSVYPGRRFFIGDVYNDFAKAKVVAAKQEVPLFVIIYDGKHPKQSKIDYSLGYFMEYQTTKKLVSENFVQVLLDVAKSEAADLVPADDPLENSRLVVITPDGRTLRSEGVYANPDEGLKKVRADIGSWKTIRNKSL